LSLAKVILKKHQIRVQRYEIIESIKLSAQVTPSERARSLIPGEELSVDRSAMP
jgi:hypothetical protein